MAILYVLVGLIETTVVEPITRIHRTALVHGVIGYATDPAQLQGRAGQAYWVWVNAGQPEGQAPTVRPATSEEVGSYEAARQATLDRAHTRMAIRRGLN